MNGLNATAARSEAVERYLSRIEAHLTRFAQGHDPFGHLFAIERLARIARAERWETDRAAVERPRR